jgi:hypothetical protein
LWNKEYIRGSQKLYWEDVKIGDEPAWTCSGPVSHATMIGWWCLNRVPVKQVLKANLKLTYKDPYGQYMFGTVRYCTGRNIPGARASFYNNTAAQFAINMVTNYIGDAGLVTRVNWYFKQVYRELWGGLSVGEDLGEKVLEKVPYMKGRKCEVHGFETDTIIAKGYVTNKYKNDKGEGIIDLSCWCENLDGEVIQVVAMAAKLPLKKG